MVPWRGFRPWFCCWFSKDFGFLIYKMKAIQALSTPNPPTPGYDACDQAWEGVHHLERTQIGVLLRPFLSSIGKRGTVDW